MQDLDPDRDLCHQGAVGLRSQADDGPFTVVDRGQRLLLDAVGAPDHADSVIGPDVPHLEQT